MSSLYELNMTLSRLYTQKEELEKQLKVQKQRKSEIENIINKVTDLDDYSINIARNLSNASTELCDGLKYTQRINSISAEILEDTEKIPALDTKLSSAMDNLKFELQKVSQKINELETQIKNTSNQIASTQSAIQAEERRLEEEARAREAAEREAAAREAALREAELKSNATNSVAFGGSYSKTANNLTNLSDKNITKKNK